MTITEDYLREVEASLRADPARKRQIVDELRSHLREKIEDIERAHPGRPRENVERQVLAEMGSPRELALAYEPEGAVLKNRSGDTILRLSEAAGRATAAVGRGVGKFLKWAAICAAVLLVIAIGVGIWAFYEVRPYALAFAEGAEPIYHFDQTCPGTPCNGALPGDTFYLANGTGQLRFDVSLYHAHSDTSDDPVGQGSVEVVVKDPEGAVRMDRAYNMTNQTRVDQELTWAGTPGNWTVEVRFTDFLGEIELTAHERVADVVKAR